MRKSVITLYVNDPMGGRWQRNLAQASRAEDELGSAIVIVKKTSPNYRPGTDPPCPSVAVDGKVVVRDGTVTYEDLETEILRDRR